MTPLNVLLVTYSFPPVGGVGVLRAASLARYLRAEGIRLDVLTARNASSVGTDTTLLAEIPASVTIHRTLALDLPFAIKKAIKKLIVGGKAGDKATAAKPAAKPSFLKRMLQDILLPDPQVTWLPALSRAARRLVKKRNIDLVLITVPPFSSVLLVEKLRKEFPLLPIVIDFRDEWLSTTIGLVSFSRSDRAMAVARRAESAAVTQATAVVAVTEAARLEIRGRYPQERDNKFQLIPNGFDATRIRRSATPRQPRADGKIVVTYIGSVYRSTEPATFVQAVQSLPEAVKSRFKIRFIGYIEEPRFREILMQLGDMVELNGFLPQHEALAAIDETDYLLLITHDTLNVPAKFYDYIGGGRPILATVHPDGDVRRMIETLRAGWWAGSRDVAGIRQLFMDAATRGASLQAAFHPDFGSIAQYERKVLATRYARLLHSIAAQPHGSEVEVQASALPERSVRNA
jgi:glycosyltransferase involved in cell wall biosynthesis